MFITNEILVASLLILNISAICIIIVKCLTNKNFVIQRITATAPNTPESSIHDEIQTPNDVEIGYVNESR